MRRLLVLLAAAGLAACSQGAPRAPHADALSACGDAEAPAASRRDACDQVLAEPDLASADRAAALSHRGELKRQTGDPTGALADFAAALAIDGEMTEAKLGRAAVLLDSGQLDAAEPLITNVIARGAPPPRAQFLLGVLRARQGNAAAALTAFDAAIAADRRNPEAYASRGALRQAQGDGDGAAADFDAALRLDPTHAGALIGRCWSRVQRRGDLAAALADAEAALTASSANERAQLCRGLIQLRREDWAEARAAYDAVLLNNPSSAEALFGRGVARRELGERDEGRDDIRQAYRINSHIDDDFKRLGVDL